MEHRHHIIRPPDPAEQVVFSPAKTPSVPLIDGEDSILPVKNSAPSIASPELKGPFDQDAGMYIPEWDATGKEVGGPTGAYTPLKDNVADLAARRSQKFKTASKLKNVGGATPLDIA